MPFLFAPILEAPSVSVAPRLRELSTKATTGLYLRGTSPHGAAISTDQSSDWRIIERISVLLRFGIAIASHNSTDDFECVEGAGSGVAGAVRENRK